MSTIKEEILKTIEQQINSQTSKGVETYGQTLDECPDDAYNWNVMVNEELIDALQYQIKENKRLKESHDAFVRIAEKRLKELEGES